MNVEKLLAKLEFEQWLIDEAQLLDDIEFEVVNMRQPLKRIKTYLVEE